MRRTRHIVLPVRSWQYIGLLVVSLACLTLGHVSRDREGRHGSLTSPELTHAAPHEVDACPNYSPTSRFLSTVPSETSPRPTWTPPTRARSPSRAASLERRVQLQSSRADETRRDSREKRDATARANRRSVSDRPASRVARAASEERSVRERGRSVRDAREYRQGGREEIGRARSEYRRESRAREARESRIGEVRGGEAERRAGARVSRKARGAADASRRVEDFTRFRTDDARRDKRTTSERRSAFGRDARIKSYMDYEYLKKTTPIDGLKYEVLRQAVVIGLCAIYGASVFKGKTSFVG
ncbi:octapeptide-repeat protein T2-like [Copidosoma floridanum]|uniref:octapeptide-repeat protein T2-like n=1 Tax=Copidosoma floridanum TaxID=29053 RepID=UPI0006C9CC48|nr:octapeptide-repeat protein T2-like [Copidosoma floridanum]